MLGKVSGTSLDCLATSINTSFPDHFTEVTNAIYYLTFQVTENGVTNTQTVSFTSNVPNTQTYTSIFSYLMREALFEYLADPVDGWADTYSVLNLNVFDNTLSGIDPSMESWENQSRPIDILFIETPESSLVGLNELQATDLYPMLKSSTGDAPTVIHSCGYANSGSTKLVEI